MKKREEEEAEEEDSSMGGVSHMEVRSEGMEERERGRRGAGRRRMGVRRGVGRGWEAMGRLFEDLLLFSLSRGWCVGMSAGQIVARNVHCVSDSNQFCSAECRGRF